MMRLMKISGERNRTNRIVSRSGVTLIELLMAVAILGVIAIVITMTLNVGVESWRTGTALADESHHADAVMEQIVMALRSAYYPETKEPTYDYGFTFEDGGESPKAEDRISWVKVGNSLIGEDVPWAGAAHRVELFMKTDDSDEGPGLYVKAWQLVGQAEDFDPEEDVTPLLLSDQVVSFDCRIKDPDYADISGEPYEWIDEWTTSNRIPTHVLISIAVKPQKEGEDPMEYTRCVEIPMAKMSWDPVQTDSSSTNRTTRAGSNITGEDDDGSNRRNSRRNNRLNTDKSGTQSGSSFKNSSSGFSKDKGETSGSGFSRDGSSSRNGGLFNSGRNQNSSGNNGASGSNPSSRRRGGFRMPSTGGSK